MNQNPSTLKFPDLSWQEITEVKLKKAARLYFMILGWDPGVDELYEPVLKNGFYESPFGETFPASVELFMRLPVAPEIYALVNACFDPEAERRS